MYRYRKEGSGVGTQKQQEAQVGERHQYSVPGKKDHNTKKEYTASSISFECHSAGLITNRREGKYYMCESTALSIDIVRQKKKTLKRTGDLARVRTTAVGLLVLTFIGQGMPYCRLNY